MLKKVWVHHQVKRNQVVNEKAGVQGDVTILDPYS